MAIKLTTEHAVAYGLLVAVVFGGWYALTDLRQVCRQADIDDMLQAIHDEAYRERQIGRRP
jgi:hypothetical protein